jgi:uncharacterized integral membrane protein
MSVQADTLKNGSAESASAPDRTSAAPGQSPPLESRGARLVRHGRRARLYAWAVLLIAVFVVLIALSAANVRAVKLDWVVGSTRASLVWIILAATLLGWLLGIATSVLFRYRTRRP